MYFRSNFEVVLFVLLIIIVLAVIIGSCAVVSSMANKRGRSEIGWVIVSLFLFPLSIILLLCLGETDEKRKERIEGEALIFWSVWDRQNRLSNQEEDEHKKQEMVSEVQEKPSGITLNDMYKAKKQ